MSWKLGGWQIYDEGPVHQTMKKCINILIDHGFTVGVDLAGEKKRLEYGKHLFETMMAYEKSHGLNDLLEILTQGLTLECTKDNKKIGIEVLLRTPSDSEENKELFKSMIIDWVEQNPLTFCERFFRLPKITEDIADRYLDCPLEQSLSRIFGFNFRYKIVIEFKQEAPELEGLRKKLYKSLH